MDSKLLKVCLALALTAGMSACDEGDYNNLDCDASYQPECLDSTAFMTCGEGNKLVATRCAGGQICKETKTENADGTTSVAVACVVEGSDTKCTASVCKDANTLSSCDTATGIASDRVCANGCDSATNDCRAAAITCNNNNVIDSGEECDGTAAISQTCADFKGEGATGSVSCANCAIDSSACVAAKCTASVCKDANTLSSCDAATGIASDRVCENGCDSAANDCRTVAITCNNNNVIDDGEECDGTAVISQTCVDFKGEGATGSVSCSNCAIDSSECVAAEIEHPTEGETCTSNEIEMCAGTDLYYCGTSGKVVKIACGDYSMACANLDMGEGATWADCADPAATCTTAGESKLGCGVDDYGDAYSDQMGCYDDLLSDKKYLFADSYLLEDETNYEACEFSCLAATGACGKLIEDQGETCDDTFTPRCDSDRSVAVTCDEGGTGSSIGAVACAADETCSILSNGEVSSALCMRTSDECAAADVNKETLSCGEDYYGDPAVLTAMCLKGDNEKYYTVQVSSESCDHGCDAATTACTKLDSTEGNTCDATYEESCLTSNATLSCDIEDEATEGVVVASECADGTTCVLDSGVASCLKACSTVDEVVGICEDSIFGSYAYQEKCTAIGSANYYVEIEESFAMCDNGCNDDATACKKLVTDEGATCDSSNFTARCDGTIAAYCSEGVVAALDCSTTEGYDCLVNKDGKNAGCYSEASKCDAASDAITECDSSNYSHDVLLTHQCTEMANGSFYDVVLGGTYCINEAGDAYTVCADANTCSTTELDSGLTYCGDEAYESSTIAAYCQTQLGICKDSYFGCYDACEAENVSQTKQTCRAYTDGSFLDTDVCTKIDASHYVYYPGEEYSKCANGCNADSSACAE